MSGTTLLRFELQAETLECCRCGIPFSFPTVAHRRRDHDTFYCPNGHAQSFKGESEEEKLKRALQAERTRASNLYNEKTALETRLQAQRRRETRTRARIQNGVCPDCNRTFTNLARHMHAKHANKEIKSA
jgi:hypothetical protein